jgi:hypothetical protein
MNGKIPVPHEHQSGRPTGLLENHPGEDNPKAWLCWNSTLDLGAQLVLKIVPLLTCSAGFCSNFCSRQGRTFTGARCHLLA